MREGIRVAVGRGLRLSGPVENVIAEQRGAFGLSEPDQRLLRVVLVVVVRAESKRGARPPDVTSVAFGESRKLFVGAGRGVVQRARQGGKPALYNLVIGRGRGDFRCRGIRSAAHAARNGF